MSVPTTTMVGGVGKVNIVASYPKLLYTTKSYIVWYWHPLCVSKSRPVNNGSGRPAVSSCATSTIHEQLGGTIVGTSMTKNNYASTRRKKAVISAPRFVPKSQESQTRRAEKHSVRVFAGPRPIATLS